MKVSSVDYETMREAIAPIMVEAMKRTELSDLRNRFDALWAAIDNGRMGSDLISDLKDTHIDTVLRKIQKSLGPEESK